MAFIFPNEYILLSTQNASNSSTIDFTSLISTNFTVYHVRIRNMIPATDDTSLQLVFSTDNGSSYLSSNYYYGYETLNSSGTRSRIGVSATSTLVLNRFLSNSSSHSLNTDIYLYNLTDSVTAKNYGLFGSYFDKTSENLEYYVQGTGLNNGTTAVNAIRFYMSSGNITSGTFYLYGVVE